MVTVQGIEYLQTSDVACITGVAATRLWEWASRGLLPAFRRGGRKRLFFRRDDVAAFLIAKPVSGGNRQTNHGACGREQRRWLFTAFPRGLEGSIPMGRRSAKVVRTRRSDDSTNIMDLDAAVANLRQNGYKLHDSRANQTRAFTRAAFDTKFAVLQVQEERSGTLICSPIARSFSTTGRKKLAMQARRRNAQCDSNIRIPEVRTETP
jgi:hypothetical protein